jgi:beta-D-xylosidase 4
VRTARDDIEGLNTPEFPQVVAMAATGNLALISRMAETISDEARALNNIANGTVFAKGAGLNYWGPTMNIGRDPRWGRFQESISEDPWLNAAYASRMVRGMQGGADGGGRRAYVKIAACCKHFYAYSLEDSDNVTRHNFDAVVSARDLAETYLPPFRACAAAGAEQIMCSYNSVNGVPTCLDAHAQSEVLRRQFGFRGMVVSDCDAISDAWTSHGYARNASDATARALRAGTDMDCGDTYARGAPEAVETGALSVSAIDTAVARSLAMRFRLGEFDEHVPYRDLNVYGPSRLDTPAARTLALQAAAESIVLLKNDPVGGGPPAGAAAGGGGPPTKLLPLLDLRGEGGGGAGELRVGVLGPTASPKWLPDDKNDYSPSFKISPLKGLLDAAIALNSSGREPRLRVLGCDDCCAAQTKHEVPSTCDKGRASAFARAVDVVVVCLGGDLGGEGRDWPARLPSDQADLAAAVIGANSRSVAVLVHGNPMAIDALIDARYTTIVEAFEGGQSGGAALASMLLGLSESSPSGVLPWTVYPDAYTEQLAMRDMAMRAGPGRTYRFFRGVPTFPFGHGLSYTSFALSWSKTPPRQQTVRSAAAGLSFAVNVTNVGARAGAKVVLAFVGVRPTAGTGKSTDGAASGPPPRADGSQRHGQRSEHHAAEPPIKQLFGMAKTAVLQPGDSAIVSVDSNALVPGYCGFCSVSTSGASEVRPGELRVTIGSGGHDAAADDLVHQLVVTPTSE